MSRRPGGVGSRQDRTDSRSQQRIDNMSLRIDPNALLRLDPVRKQEEARKETRKTAEKLASGQRINRPLHRLADGFHYFTTRGAGKKEKK